MRRLDEILKGSTASNVSLDATAGSSTANDESYEEEDLCPLCGGAGFVRRNVPLGHADFGKAFPCECILQETEEARLARLYRYSNLGPLSRVTFESLAANDGELGPALEAARLFANEPQGWLVLTGPSGSGKTRLAAAVTNCCIQNGRPTLFMVVPDLLDHLRGAYDAEADMPYDSLFEQVSNAPVLVLDELGAQAPTPWAQEKLFQLINHRYNNRLPTIFTLALPLEALEDRLRTRLADAELAQIITLAKRVAKSDGYTNILSLPKLAKMTFANFSHSGNELRQRITTSFRLVDEKLDGRPLQDKVERAMQNLRMIYSSAKGYADNPEGWLVLLGDPGRGKTHLAAAIGHIWEDKGLAFEFCVVPDLLEELRSGYQGNRVTAHVDRKLDQILTAPYLILDDLGVHNATPWAQEKLFQILNYRYNAKLPTVITISRALEELPESWVSRMHDHEVSLILEFEAPNYRVSLSKQAQIQGRSPSYRPRA